MKQTTSLIAWLIFLTIIAAGAYGTALAGTTTGPKPGGVIKAAYASDPHSLDIHKELSTTALDVGRHIFESLYVYTENFKPVPLLAKSYQVDADALIHTVTLREGISFHNGKALTAQDVVASFNRWTRVAPLRPEIASFIDTVEAPDKATVVFRLKEPYADFIHALMFGVMPKEVVEAYPSKTIPDSEVIGSGPYKFKDREIDRYVELVRFEKYTPPPQSADLAIHAYADKLIFNIVPDPTIRLLGIETGQYHYIESANYNDYDRIRKDPGMEPLSLGGAVLYFLMNCKTGPLANLKLRQAVQAAVDCEPILKSAFTHPELYSLDGSWMSQETKWHSRAGTELYNQKNPVKAKKLLQEGGYDGSPIVVITLGEIDYLRNSVSVLVSQLNQVGFKTELQFVDQGTLVPRMMNPAKWQIVYLIQPSLPTPTMLPWTKQITTLGWWSGEKKIALAHQLRSELDPARRFKIWEDMQALCYSDAPRVKIGDASTLAVVSTKIGGCERKAGVGTRFWNAWLK